MSEQQPPDNEFTDFGYRKVPPEQKASRVAEVFHSVAAKYDVMNDLMSLGVHRIWKRIAVVHSSLRPGDRVLDLAGGTGDLAALMAPRVGDSGLVVLADINDSMLRQGRSRLIDKGIVSNVRYVQADAEMLPFPDNYFSHITIAFGLRNVTHKDRALAAMYRVLKPGGRALVLEFSKPVVPALNKIYDVYSFSVLPVLGRVVAKDETSYRYLAESIRMHPDQQTLLDLMQAQGFEACRYFNLTGGIVALHEGFKY